MDHYRRRVPVGLALERPAGGALGVPGLAISRRVG